MQEQEGGKLTVIAGLWTGNQSIIERIIDKASGCGLVNRQTVGVGGKCLVLFSNTSATIITGTEFADTSAERWAPVMIADIRLGNREDLCDMLGIDGTVMNDGQLLQQAYRRWTIACLSRLRGEFSFVVWDLRCNRLYGGCDPLGNRTLYYRYTDDGFLFASSAALVAALSGQSARIDERKLALFLTGADDSTTSFYDGVRQLPAAHSLSVDDEQLNWSRYWQPPTSASRRFLCDTDCIDAFGNVFYTAVRRCLDDKKTGAFLSGGLDSSAVVAVASRQLSRQSQLSTVTSVPRPGFARTPRPGWDIDETGHVETLRSWLGNIEPHYIDLAAPSPLNGLEELFPLLDGPVLVPVNRLWMEAIIKAARKRGIEVLLTGQLGNATVSYHGLTWLSQLARQGRLWQLNRQVNALATANRRSYWSIFRQYVLGPLLTVSWQPYRRPGSTASWLSLSAINPALAEIYDIDGVHRQRQTDSADWRRRFLTDGSIQTALRLQQAWRDRYGIELRDPTADLDVIEFCLSIPDNQYLRDGCERYLIRRAMKGFMPDELRWKTRRGEQAPDWSEWLTAGRNELIREIGLLEQSDTAQRCLDLPRLRRLIEHWPQDGWHRPRQISDYRTVLWRGLTVGRFIRWFENHH